MRTPTVQELDLERLLSVGYIVGFDVSPDGRFLTFCSTSSGFPQIYVQSLESGDVTQLTNGSERAIRPQWSPKGDLIAFLQDVGGDENYQVYVISPEGGEARDVTGRPGKLHENFAWSWDGSRITYVSNRDGQFDVYFSDVASGEVHRVTNHPSVHHAPEFSPDGRMIAFASNRTEYRNNWDTFVISLEDGKEWKITEHEGEADEMSYYAGQSARWSPDGRRVLIASSVPGNYDIMAIDVQTLQREWIANSKWDENNAQWSPDGSSVAYVVNEDGNLVIHVKNLSDGRSWPVSQPEGVSGSTFLRAYSGTYRWTPDGEQIVYNYDGPDESSSIWMVPASGGKPRCVHGTLPDDIQRSDFVHPEIVRYPSFDGRQIAAFLYRPRGTTGPGPAIVMPHGGPTGQSLNHWSPALQYLVSKGYTMLVPNFRGSTGYGTEFQWLNRNDWGGGDLQDVVAGANWLEEQGIADRIGITGGSYGGYMTMMAVTKAPERWKAAVADFPMVDLVGGYEQSREDMRQFQIRNIGTPEENPDLYYDRSPVNFVQNIRCPVMILQGDRDPRCRIEEVEMMRDRLAEAGTTFEYVVYEHEGHGFARRENQIDAYRRTADFFDRYLR